MRLILMGRGPAILVASRAGGVGKTTIAAILAAMGAGRRVVSVDRTTREGSSRLGQLLRPQAVEDLSISPKIGASDDKLDIARYWIPFDVLAGVLKEGDCVIDFGANVIQFFCDWAEAGDKIEQIGLGEVTPAPILVVPTTATARSLADAREAFEAFSEAGIPTSMQIVVFNEMLGSIESVGGPDFEWFRNQEEAGNLAIVRMPRSTGFGMIAVESGKASFTSLPFVSPARFAHFTALDEMRAAHSVLHFCYFATSTAEGFFQAGLGGPHSRPGWSREGLFEALDRAHGHYTKFAAIRQTDILEKIRSAVADREGVGLGEVMARMRPFDRTLLVEIFPELFVRLQEEFIDAEVAHRAPDAKAVARGFEGLRLSGERRRRRVSEPDSRTRMSKTDVKAAIQVVASGVTLNDPRAARLRRMEEIRFAYGDFFAIPVVLLLWIFRRL